MSVPNANTILFDLDGTLLDSVALILASYRHTMEVHRGVSPPDDEWISGMGRPLQVQLRAFARDDAQADAMLETYRAHNMEHHDDMVRPFPGVPDALAALRERQVSLAIVSSKLRRGVLRGLRLCDLEAYFPVIVAADDVQHPKPHPEPVLRALELLGAHPTRTVFVGDSPHDLVAGRAAGVQTAAVAWGPFPHDALRAENPDYWIGTTDHLVTLAANGKQPGTHPGASP